MSVVNLFVTVNKETMVANERRFDKGLTVAALKSRLELIVGTPPEHMRLQLFDRRDQLVCAIDDDTRMLGAYPVEDYMRLHVIDSNPTRRVGEFSDVSAVPKYEMPEDEYAKRSDSVRAFKERNKLGRFADVAPDTADEYAEEAQAVHVGDRCECEVGDMQIRGTVRFVGKAQFALGHWVGVHLDEPVGKNDGSVAGTQYFSCPDKYGIFVRPDRVKVGDYPEEDFEM
eukprot:Unigene15365_Nuclearia_a/m.45940 Unigene15365_Nuclearia_a/g.45940  ORF Unigene15365_Nuclearia_a/g.45940 Unigene15365_Nuclearia_a/m.45940 type:complete len:228 (+) Unigene15365_Nuclearia_a:86-769(+)